MSEDQQRARARAIDWRRRADELDRKARLLRFSGDQAGAEELETTAADYRADAGWLELELACAALAPGEPYLTCDRCSIFWHTGAVNPAPPACPNCGQPWKTTLLERPAIGGDAA